jgi:hypothetical protein
MKYKKSKKLPKAALGINDKYSIVEPKSETKLAQPKTEADVPQVQQQLVHTFGSPNWNNIYGSEMAQGLMGYLSNHSSNSYQNAILNFNRQHNSPLNSLSSTPNYSLQDQYGTSQMADGGELPINGNLTGDEDYDYLFGDETIPQVDKPQSAPKKRATDQTPQPEEPDYNAGYSPTTGKALIDLLTTSPMEDLKTSRKDINLKGVNPFVLSAASELQSKFPGLQITSGIRNWGDKDAHPKGRAVDMAGDNLDAAWSYYKNTLVPKYGFNQALPENHGTGPHIHVGYYADGGELGPGPKGDTPSYYGKKDMDLLMRNNQSVEYRQSAPGSIHTGSGFVTYLGDTLTNNQIPYAAHQAYEKYGISGDWRVSNSLRGPEDKQFIIQAANNAQYKLSPTDLKKIDAHTQGHQILYAHNDNFLPAPKYAEGGDKGKTPGSNVYRSQMEIDAANQNAKAFALNHPWQSSLINPEDVYVARNIGDPKVQYVNPDGSQFIPQGTTRKKAMSLPNDVKPSDIQSYGSSYWYTDPHSGDIVDVDSSLVGAKQKHGKGGSIHIKKSHEGAFTVYKKRTGKTTSEALHSKDPHVRQMANFARNAAKWHHGDGGMIYEVGGEYDLSPDQILRLKSAGFEFE